MLSSLIAVLVLGFVIAIHELGHFLVAKLLKVGVLEYALGFGRALFSRRFGETRYSLRLIPLGGYVRMAGDEPSATEKKTEQIPGEAEIPTPEHWGQNEPDEIEKRLMADESRWFLRKPTWARALIIFAGPASNLLSAIVLSIFTLWVWGATIPVDLPVIGQVMPGSPAKRAEFKPGDRVLSVNGKEVQTWVELAGSVHDSDGKELAFNIERTLKDGTKQNLTLKAAGEKEQDDLAFIDSSLASKGFRIGIGPAGKREKVGFSEAAIYGSQHIWKLSVITLRGIAGLVMGKIALKNLGGPIFIFGETMRSADQGLADLFEFIVFLSVSLAVLNLLPLPVLDGGHLMFLFIEAIKGSPVNSRVMELATQVGIVLLLVLSAFAIGNDLLRVVTSGL